MSATIFDWKTNIPESELETAVDILTRGGVIIFPTDTVYGLACNCFDETAIHRIYNFKHRPLTKPTNILTNSIEKLTLVAKPLNSTETQLAEKYFPGPLTLILDKLDAVPACLTAGLPTVGVRIPGNPIALRLLSALDFPLATTSVNLAGDTPGVELSDFLNEFKDKVDLIIDGGPSPLRVPSTIIRVENSKPITLRQGPISI